MAQTRRYVVKMTKIYTVYDFATGEVVGDSFEPEVNRIVLKPRGLDIEAKADASSMKWDLAQAEAMHNAVAKIRWGKYLK